MKPLSKNNSALLFILVIGVLVVTSVISHKKIIRFNESVDEVMHTITAKTNIIEVLSNIKDAEIGQRGYLISKDTTDLHLFHSAERLSNLAFAALDTLFINNEEQQQNLIKLKFLTSERYKLLENNIDLLKESLPLTFGNGSSPESKNKMKEVREQVNLMLDLEDKLMQNRKQFKDRSANVTPVFLLLISLLSILAVTLFFFLLQKEADWRLSMSESNAALIKANKEIEESEYQFRNFANSIHSLAWIAKSDGWVSWYNRRWYEYTGSTIEEMEGWGWEKVHHPDHINKVKKFVEEAWKKNVPWELTFLLRRHDGDYRWFLTRVVPVKSASGTVERWIGTNTDITEQKFFAEQLERNVNERTSELEDRKNLFESIFETSKESIAVYAKDFTVLSINKATETLMGRKREEVIGKTLLELMPESKGTKEESDLRNALEGNNIYNEPYQSSLSGRYIENYIRPLRNADGEVYAAVAMANDVTEIILKQKEIEIARDQLQLQNQTFEIAESIANFGSYKWNMQTGTLEYSDNLFRLLDCDPQEFVATLDKFLTFVHPDDLQQVISDGELTMQTGELAEKPYRIVSKIGVVKYFRSSGNFSGEGENRLLIGAVQDISKDVEATKILKIKNLELENANAELASFSYVASHDLKEPLRKIQGFSKRIIDKDGDKLSDTTKDYFNRMINAAQRMQNLIESLISFSSTNLSEAFFEKVDLNLILLEVKTTLYYSITQKNAFIESENLPTLNAVPVQMHQLFLNLISNSLKYSKPDVPPHIKINAEKIKYIEINGRVKQNGYFWKITISDNGIGFEQQYENKIFEMFQRLHGKTEYEGTGIGLAICKKIVLTHNGTIEATGEIGVGATFTFFLSDNNKS